MSSANRPGIDRIVDAFRTAAPAGGAILPFVTGGYPRLDGFGESLAGLAAAGASAIEIGIPFSDPIADGPVIAESMHEALGAGVTPEGVCAEVEKIRGSVAVPLLAMVSASIALRSGLARFLDRCAAAGFDGLIVPDLDLDLGEEFRDACAARGLASVFLVAPDTTPERRLRLAGLSSGFVYLLARAGVTGERSELPDLAGPVAALRSVAPSTPIAAGFGISTPDQVRAVLAHADGAIVGSALVRRIGEAARRGQDPAEAAVRFLAELVAARGPRGGTQ